MNAACMWWPLLSTNAAGFGMSQQLSHLQRNTEVFCGIFFSLAFFLLPLSWFHGYLSQPAFCSIIEVHRASKTSLEAFWCWCGLLKILWIGGCFCCWRRCNMSLVLMSGWLWLVCSFGFNWIQSVSRRSSEVHSCTVVSLSLHNTKWQVNTSISRDCTRSIYHRLYLRRCFLTFDFSTFSQNCE